MKPILIGVSNPHSADPADALAPWPKNSAGWRLQQISGLSAKDYCRKFERRNLETHAIADVPRGAVVVLLGEEVRRHVGIPKLLIHPQSVGGRTFRQIPHPSGRCLFYNDLVLRDLVGIMLRSL